MKIRKRYIIGNWKTNPKSSEDAEKIIRSTEKILKRKQNIFAGLAIPAPLLLLAKKKSFLAFGSQDIGSIDEGAYTGRFTATQVKKTGATFTIIGHSEMRAFGDTDQAISEKIKQAAKAKLPFVLCVGEGERDSHGEYLKIIRDQLRHALLGDALAIKYLKAIAYEPVWAIGKKAVKSATPEESLEVSIHIRRTLRDMYGEKKAKSVPILYGGSVDERNAESFLKHGGVEGLLVGRASLSPKQFGEILAQA